MWNHPHAIACDNFEVLFFLESYYHLYFLALWTLEMLVTHSVSQWYFSDSCMIVTLGCEDTDDDYDHDDHDQDDHGHDTQDLVFKLIIEYFLNIWRYISASQEYGIQFLVFKLILKRGISSMLLHVIATDVTLACEDTDDNYDHNIHYGHDERWPSTIGPW